MDLIARVPAADLLPIKLIAASSQFAVYGNGRDSYLLVEQKAGSPSNGVRLSEESLFRISELLAAVTQDVLQKRGNATERRELYQDDLTEERQISPVGRDRVAATLVLDPIEGDDGNGQPLTAQ